LDYITLQDCAAAYRRAELVATQWVKSRISRILWPGLEQGILA